ncbi:hypothetical protein Dvina_35690 [Dactylosporangium vinaceum]|uniref:Uncharacterized protein n=1 Tax=Dactylosporangium vinaceum TaxID=53362 RepID=A0ABV5MJJ1_9ACTN|nr:hypothetical protein [Dactylosporangium vinaceum]UAB93557.1 hypothetical protein Dvina_35690 [Dactylosporangium vinaceum]
MRNGRTLIALAVALLAGGVLLATTHRTPTPPPARAPAVAAMEKPSVAISANLADGTDYTPLFYVTAPVSVGTAPTPDDTADRLLLRSPTGDRELHRLAKGRYAQFLGFTAAAGRLYWAESSALAGGGYETRLWTAAVEGTDPPVSLTADMGAAVFFDSEFDLVVADGRVNWIAAAPDSDTRTELRSVAVTGGPVTTVAFAGRFRHTAWPWLLSVDDAAPLVLADPLTGARRTVTKAAAESVVCTPTWCRSMVTAAGDRYLFDVRHPDGSARRRVPGNLNAITVDAAIGGRYEIFTEYRNERSTLVAYDLDTSTMQTLTENTGVSAARAGVVWWAEGGEWRSVDLR